VRREPDGSGGKGSGNRRLPRPDGMRRDSVNAGPLAWKVRIERHDGSPPCAFAHTPLLGSHPLFLVPLCWRPCASSLLPHVPCSHPVASDNSYYVQKRCQPIADGWHVTPPVGKRWGTSCPTVAMLRNSPPFETASGCHVSATSLPGHFRLAGPARPMHQDDTQPPAAIGGMLLSLWRRGSEEGREHSAQRVRNMLRHGRYRWLQYPAREFSPGAGKKSGRALVIIG